MDVKKELQSLYPLLKSVKAHEEFIDRHSKELTRLFITGESIEQFAEVLRIGLDKERDDLRQRMQLIDLVGDPEIKKIMKLRYLKGIPWERIAECEYISCRTVYRLNSRGIKEIENKLTAGARAG